MKSIDPSELDRLPGIRLRSGDTFRFRCHPGLACFNRCCRNLNLFLYPYDVVRLKNALQISSDRFIDQYTDIVIRDGNAFPDVLLRMADNPERTCPFLAAQGCRVYRDRPDTCRTFPVEQGLIFDARAGTEREVHFFRPPDFCEGRHEEACWTLDAWKKDQEAIVYNRMTVRWCRVKQLFAEDPWGVEGPEGSRAKMAFMSTYNMDRFRDFVFGSTLLKRYRVHPDRVRKIRKDDAALLEFGFEWVKLFVFNIPTKMIRPR